MKVKNKKTVVQMTCSDGEFSTIKLIAHYSKFRSISEYLRSLVTADVVAKKKSNPERAWVYGEGYNDWSKLSEEEKELYMNQLGPVPPGSLDYYLKELGGPGQMPINPNNELGI